MSVNPSRRVAREEPSPLTSIVPRYIQYGNPAQARRMLPMSKIQPIDTTAAIKVAAFREALRAFMRVSELNVQANGLTPQRYLLLLMIKGAKDGSECSTVTDLSARLRLAQATTSELVDEPRTPGSSRASSRRRTLVSPSCASHPKESGGSRDPSTRTRPRGSGCARFSRGSPTDRTPRYPRMSEASALWAKWRASEAVSIPSPMQAEGVYDYLCLYTHPQSYMAHQEAEWSDGTARLAVDFGVLAGTALVAVSAVLDLLQQVVRLVPRLGCPGARGDPRHPG